MLFRSLPVQVAQAESPLEPRGPTGADGCARTRVHASIYGDSMLDEHPALGSKSKSDQPGSCFPEGCGGSPRVRSDFRGKVRSNSRGCQGSPRVRSPERSRAGAVSVHARTAEACESRRSRAFVVSVGVGLPTFSAETCADRVGRARPRGVRARAPPHGLGECIQASAGKFAAVPYG